MSIASVRWSQRNLVHSDTIKQFAISKTTLQQLHNRGIENYYKVV